jgi:ATP-binding cassette subfamily F protein 3
MLQLRQLSLSRGPKVLLEKVDLTLYEKQKIGLIGANGCGKSTLFDLLLNKLVPDTGDFFINPKLRISHLSQQLPDSDEKALDFVLAGDEAHMQLIQRLEEAEKQQDDEVIFACHDALSHSGGYAKPAQAASILSGLGFSAEDQEASVNHFSGGWRMRLNLARCLMKPADLLLLDEPTNHLDMEAIFWLERFLKQSPATLILISHDRTFLDGLVTHILQIHNQKISLYTGDYSTFERTHAQQLLLQQALFEKQQSQINHLMSFVNRFKAKASKAKQAQSRLKAIERMELVAAAHMDSPFSFRFFPCPKASNPLIQCHLVQAGYERTQPILKKINLSLAPGDRIALLGPNGEGKSTLIKTLTGHLAPLQGDIHRSTHLKIGYFAQHQLDDLDCSLSPVETIQKLSPEVREQNIRDFLGGFNFIGDMALQPMRHFSGGEKARVALAKLVWLKPNLLLLDEPTNHLDLDMRASIELALLNYEGALILISHDRHLLKATVDEFYLVYNQHVSSFDGDLDDYHSWLLNKNSAKAKAKTQSDSKEKKNIQNRIKKLEQLIEQHQKKIQELNVQLGASYLYEDQKTSTTLLEEKEKSQKSLHELEEEWLALNEDLDLL